MSRTLFSKCMEHVKSGVLLVNAVLLTHTDTVTRPTLRERRRQDLTEEIREAARARLTSDGLAALSLRAIARDLGMAVSALYRYFPSRDDLVTALLVEAYTAQADAVEAAVAAAGTDDTGSAIRAGLLAFRKWSVDHPVEYGLMYGTPLPGYAAPPERLYEPGTRVAQTLYGLVARADGSGRLDRDVARRRRKQLPRGYVEQVDAWRRRRVPQMRLDAVLVAVDIWIRTQGLLSLELFGQLRPVLPDASELFASTLDDTLAAAGLRLD